MMKPSIAEIAAAVPVPGTYNYRIPKELESSIAPGSRVLVPFGRRQVTGYVLEMPDDASSTDFELKDIIKPLDDEPLFETSMVPFFRFLAGYYHYPIGMVIAEALPAGLKVMSHRTIILTPEGREAIDNGLPTVEETEFIDLLKHPQGLKVSTLTKEKGETLKVFRVLKKKGWVEVDARLRKDRVRQLKQRWISHAPESEHKPARVGPRESELLDLLHRNGPASVDELKPKFPSLAQIIPRLVEKGRILVEEKQVYRDILGRALNFNKEIPVLTGEQSKALDSLKQALEAAAYKTFLLHGVTGSGKTEIYLAAAQASLDLGRPVLFLVPEISLTPALEGLIRSRFDEDIAVLHSGLSDGERYDQWLKIRRCEVRIVIGARSAVFAPLVNPGLIVVDEEHDGAYKQEDKLQYQARDLAVLRGRQCNAVVCLGSATPSLESFQAAQTGRYKLLSLTKRVGGGRLPQVDIVDLRYDSGRRRSALTPVLKRALAETLEKERQALLFINRRGLAGMPICLSCGHVLKCMNCSVTLTLHQQNETSPGERLNCHHCGFEIPPPERCPECASRLFRYLGVGTERLEKEVQKAFPEANVARLDADAARPKGEMTRILGLLRDRKIDVLVGTQMITKGHDFPNITLVGVIEADLGLHLPDFRAGERTFQLLAQVGGRAGRGDEQGRVVVQTYSPDHYTLLLARHHDYLGFFREEIEMRRELGYPPFSRMALVRFIGNSETRTYELAHASAELGRRLIGDKKSIDLMGPAASPLAKVKGRHRFQILVRGDLVKPLHAFLNHWLDRVRPMLKGQGVNVALDVDPYHMM